MMQVRIGLYSFRLLRETLREGGRERHSHTHTPIPVSTGPHGFAVLVVRNSTSAMDAWETCTPPPPPVLASDWVPTQSVGWAQFYKELIVPFVVNLFFLFFRSTSIIVNVLVLLLRSIYPSSSLPFILFSLSSTRAPLNPRPSPPTSLSLLPHYLHLNPFLFFSFSFHFVLYIYFSSVLAYRPFHFSRLWTETNFRVHPTQPINFFIQD